jgi:hypothetical protein
VGDALREKVSDCRVKAAVDPIEFARCFLRLANLPNFTLDRLNRYENSHPSYPLKRKTALAAWVTVLARRLSACGGGPHPQAGPQFRILRRLDTNPMTIGQGRHLNVRI